MTLQRSYTCDHFGVEGLEYEAMLEFCFVAYTQ